MHMNYNFKSFFLNAEAHFLVQVSILYTNYLYYIISNTYAHKLVWLPQKKFLKTSTQSVLNARKRTLLV